MTNSKGRSGSPRPMLAGQRTNSAILPIMPALTSRAFSLAGRAGWGAATRSSAPRPAATAAALEDTERENDTATLRYPNRGEPPRPRGDDFTVDEGILP